MPQISEAGKPTLVGFELQNNGTLEAKDVKVSLGGISNDTFTISSGFNSKYVEKYLEEGQPMYTLKLSLPLN